MKKLPVFEEWVNLAFDHPVTDPVWWADTDIDGEMTQATEALNLEYCIKLFENPQPALDKFSDAQICQGFQYLMMGDGQVAFPVVDDEIPAMYDLTLPLSDRKRFINAIHPVFEFLARKCPGEEENPISYLICNWWETYRGNPAASKQPEIKQAYLHLFINILRIDNYFCQVSSIEELGHAFPREAVDVIEDFLKTPKISPKSKEFALQWKKIVEELP